MNMDEILKKIGKGDLDFRYADLEDADLEDADLRNADLQDANLQNANLQRADLRRANLEDANLDFACWPLHCGSLHAIIDSNQARQLAYHLCAVLPKEHHSELGVLFDFANGWSGIEKHNLESPGAIIRRRRE